MTSKAVLFALLSICGASAGCIALPALAQEATVGERADHSPAKRSFSNRVWVQDEADRPGAMLIFLSDGTLVQDSCWETHRLSQWQMTSATDVTWNEDGMDVAAEIVSVSSGDLVLSIKLGSESIEERYVAATVPYVCPDMPR